MSVQRKRGQMIKYWLSVETTNLRGDKVDRALDGPYETRAWVIPQRSSRAEVPGQQEINVFRLGVDASLNIDLWARIEWQGGEWDIVSPPALRFGTRHTRHKTVDIRRRTVTNG